MKYYKSKEVITDLTVLRLVAQDTILYDKIGDIEYYGLSEEIDMSQQHSECEVEEVEFADIKLILDNCRLMQQLNQAIENKIAEKYTISKEIGLTNSDHSSEEYVAYRAYVAECKAEINAKKIELGLKQNA